MSTIDAFANRLQVFGACASVGEIATDPAWRKLDSCVRTLGFKHWTYSAAPTCAWSVTAAPDLTLSTYPIRHMASYFGNRFDRTSPGSAEAQVGQPARSFSAIRESAPPGPKLSMLLRLNRVHDVTRGLAIPLGGAFGTRGILTLAYQGGEAELDSSLAEVTSSLLALASDLHLEVQRNHADSFLLNRLPRLSAKQVQLLRLFADGYGNSEVADRLSRSIHTIDKRVAHLKAALGARSIAQLTALSLRWDLLS